MIEEVKISEEDFFDPTVSFDFAFSQEKFDFFSFIEHYQNEPEKIETVFGRCNDYESKTRAFNKACSIIEKLNKKEKTNISFRNVFENITTDRKSHKALICISGFLSQKDNMADQWKGVIDYTDSDLPVFAYRWPAKSFTDLQSPLLKNKHLISTGVSLAMKGTAEYLKSKNKNQDEENKEGQQISSLLTWDNLKTAASLAAGAISVSAEYSKMFNHAREMASKYGKLLGYCIILGYPFMHQQINLLAFSLGCQVIKSCLEVLDQYGYTGIIDNVYMLGGATTIESSEYNLLKPVNTKFVN